MTNEELREGIRAANPGMNENAVEAQAIIVDAIQVLLNEAGEAVTLRCLQSAIIATMLASSADALAGQEPN